MATSLSALDSIHAPAAETGLRQAAANPPAAVTSSPPQPTSSSEDTATISAASQEAEQQSYPQMLRRVLQLTDQGQSVDQIATALKISPQSVQGYLDIPIGASLGPKIDTTA